MCLRTCPRSDASSRKSPTFCSQSAFRQAQFLDGPEADLGGILQAGLPDLNDLPGYQFSERIASILYANRTESLLVGAGKTRDLFRAKRRVLKYSVDGQLFVPCWTSVASGC